MRVDFRCPKCLRRSFAYWLDNKNGGEPENLQDGTKFYRDKDNVVCLICVNCGTHGKMTNDGLEDVKLEKVSEIREEDIQAAVPVDANIVEEIMRDRKNRYKKMKCAVEFENNGEIFLKDTFDLGDGETITGKIRSELIGILSDNKKHWIIKKFEMIYEDRDFDFSSVPNRSWQQTLMINSYDNIPSGEIALIQPGEKYMESFPVDELSNYLSMIEDYFLTLSAEWYIKFEKYISAYEKGKLEVLEK